MKMQVTHRKDTNPFITKDGSEIREFYHSENMSLAEATVKVGRATERHYHKTSEEIYYILNGKGLMELETEKREVSKDHVIIIPPKCKHRISNTGEKPLSFLCHCSPPYSDEDTVLTG
jgi:mannose-6-phosphate isomerase-like protein (cupin superfamily)